MASELNAGSHPPLSLVSVFAVACISHPMIALSDNFYPPSYKFKWLEVGIAESYGTKFVFWPLGLVLIAIIASEYRIYS